MKKYLVLAAVAALFAATPAMAQTAQPTSSTETAHPTPTPAPCATGCPAQVTVMSIGQFGGTLAGGFGTFNTQGQLVAGSNISGTTTGSKTGRAISSTDITYDGCLTITCGTTNIKVNISAFEQGQMAVTATNNTPGQLVVLSNSGTMASGGGFAIGSSGVAPTPSAQ